MTKKITVQGNSIQLSELNGEKYISLTDMSRTFENDPNVLIARWMRRKDTIEYLGTWEKLHNQNFKPLEFEGFKKEAGTKKLL